MGSGVGVFGRGVGVGATVWVGGSIVKVGSWEGTDVLVGVDARMVAEGCVVVSGIRDAVGEDMV